MFKKVRNITRGKSVLDMERKEVSIPLGEYSDLLAKETMLEQIARAVAKDDSDFGTMAILKAILQIDTPKK